MLFRKKTKPIKLDVLEQLDALEDSGKPIFLDFWQAGCQSCRTMDGIVNELADEYGESAHVVKIDVRSVPGAAERFRIRSTPTFVVLARPPAKKSKKKRHHADDGQVSERWRASGLIKKDQLQRALERNGASIAE